MRTTFVLGDSLLVGPSRQMKYDLSGKSFADGNHTHQCVGWLLTDREVETGRLRRGLNKLLLLLLEGLDTTGVGREKKQRAPLPLEVGLVQPCC